MILGDSTQFPWSFPFLIPPLSPLFSCFLLKAPTSSLPFSFSGANFAFYFTEKTEEIREELPQSPNTASENIPES